MAEGRTVFAWIACAVPTILGTLAIVTAPITTHGKFGAVAGAWTLYLFVVGILLPLGGPDA